MTNSFKSRVALLQWCNSAHQCQNDRSGQANGKRRVLQSLSQCNKSLWKDVSKPFYNRNAQQPRVIGYLVSHANYLTYDYEFEYAIMIHVIHK